MTINTRLRQLERALDAAAAEAEPFRFIMADPDRPPAPGERRFTLAIGRSSELDHDPMDDAEVGR
ncbi:MAG TPA: hypothetical protein VFS08_10445 [Gemmatimonadaceae bacterium]|nr:hypothetical protein [Gemmatimonadaceae bacterium]